MTKVAGNARSNNSDFIVNSESDAIAEKENFIPQASAHVNKNENSTDIELVENLTNIKKGYFTSGDNTLESKALKNYFATSDSVQHSWRCIEILGTMPVVATNKGDKFIIDEFGDIINVYYYIDE